MWLRVARPASIVNHSVESYGRSEVVASVWRWLAAPGHRPLLRLWAEGYVRSLVDPSGPWARFAEATVGDWLELLATGDERRTTAAVDRHLRFPAP